MLFPINKTKHCFCHRFSWGRDFFLSLSVSCLDQFLRVGSELVSLKIETAGLYRRKSERFILCLFLNSTLCTMVVTHRCNRKLRACQSSRFREACCCGCCTRSLGVCHEKQIDPCGGQAGGGAVMLI